MPAADRKPKPKSAQPENQPSDEMEYYEEVIAPQLASVEMDDTNDGKTETDIDAKTGKISAVKLMFPNVLEATFDEVTSWPVLWFLY